MFTNKEVENKIRKALKGKVEFIYFVNETIGNRTWFFDGINYLIRKGQPMKEVYIQVTPISVNVINGEIEESDTLIPQSNLALFIHAPAIKNGVDVNKMIIDIKNSMVDNRDIIITNTLLDVVRVSSNSSDFLVKLRTKLGDLEEDKLYRLEPSELFSKITDILNLNESGNDGSMKTAIVGNEYILRTYDGRDESMVVRFPLNKQGLFGFASYLAILAESIPGEPEELFKEYVSREGNLMLS